MDLATYLLLGDSDGATTSRGPVTEPVHADGMIFRLPDGRPWRYKGCSMFRALQRWDRGENLAPLVAWTHQVGGNVWRIFCQHSERFGPDPQRATIPPSRIRQFAQWAGGQGLRLELTIICDAEQLGQDFAAQQARIIGIVQAVADLPNVFVELYNEPHQNSNGVDPDDMARACGYDQPGNRPVLMATGSSSVLDKADLLVLDYMTTHGERKEDWSVEAGKIGFFLHEGWGSNDHNQGWRGAFVPIVDDEPIGAAEVQKRWSRDNRPDAFEDGGGGYGVGTAGGTFHFTQSTDMSQIVVPGPIVTACATAFFSGMDFFPADAPTGKYTHGGYRHHPIEETRDGSIGEDAGRVQGDLAYLAIAQPVPGWPGPKLKPGWRIVRQNERGNLLELRRG